MGHSNLAAADDDFDVVREAALRDFDVRLVSGLWESVKAHHHDSGHGPGHLHFITVTDTGHHEIRTFNVDEWREVVETTPPERRVLYEDRRAYAVRILNVRNANPQKKVS